MKQRDEWVGDPLLGLGGGPHLETLRGTRGAHTARGDPSVAGSHGFGEGDSPSDPEPGEARRPATQPLDGRIQLGTRGRRGSLGGNGHGRG